MLLAHSTTGTAAITRNKAQAYCVEYIKNVQIYFKDQNCFHFRKPQRRHFRIQAKTFHMKLCRPAKVQKYRSIPPAGELHLSRDSSVVLRSGGFVVTSGFKRQSDAVDAESLACRLRSVVKHMSQMCVALANKRHADVVSVEKYKVAL